MATTEECKEELAQLWWLSKELTGEDATRASDWKRVHKRNNLGSVGGVTRTFEYTPTGARYKFITIGEDEVDDYEVIHDSGWFYHFGGDGETIFLCFEPQGHWEKDRCLYGQHTSSTIEALFGVDVESMGAEEMCENQYHVDPEQREEIEAALVAAGFTTNAGFSAFIDECAVEN